VSVKSVAARYDYARWGSKVEDKAVELDFIKSWGLVAVSSEIQILDPAVERLG
jgi:hypothetical protein